MTNELIHINNAETGEVITRELTDAEQKIRDKDKADLQKQAELEAEALTAKAVAKAALLAKLGITQEEADLLLA